MARKLEPVPCPFCGGVATVDTWQAFDGKIGGYSPVTQTRCDNPRCLIQPYGRAYKRRSDSIHAWNRRTRDD